MKLAVEVYCIFLHNAGIKADGWAVVSAWAGGKRIESCKVNDIALSTLLKILRISGTLEGVVGLVPELPDSPFLINEKTGKRIQRINSKRKMA